MSKTKIAVYGSLRPGCYNFQGFKEAYGEDVNAVDSEIIDGYTLYSLGSYPCLVKDPESEAEIHLDILEVSDGVLKHIRGMELGAGYIEETIQLEDGSNAYIYLYREPPYGCPVVESGDWVSFVQQKLEDA